MRADKNSLNSQMAMCSEAVGFSKGWKSPWIFQWGYPNSVTAVEKQGKKERRWDFRGYLVFSGYLGSFMSSV